MKLQKAQGKRMLACLLLACLSACSPVPPEELLRPEVRSVSESAGPDSVELTAVFSHVGNITSARFEIAPEEGGRILLPATQNGDAFQAECHSLEPEHPYVYYVIFSNGKDEITAGPYSFTTPARTFDPAILSCLLAGYDADRDGRMSPEELLAVKELQLLDIRLESQAGLEQLVNLERLYMAANGLRCLDFTANRKLENLMIERDPFLKEIRLDNPSLLLIFLNGTTGLRSLDFSRCPMLYICQLYDTPLETIDFSANPDLYTFRFSGTALKELDLSDNRLFRHLESAGNPALETVWLPEGIVLESCDIEGHTRIQYK